MFSFIVKYILYGIHFLLYIWCKTTNFITVKAEKMEMEEDQIPNHSGRKMRDHEVPELEDAMKEFSNTK